MPQSLFLIALTSPIGINASFVRMSAAAGLWPCCTEPQKSNLAALLHLSFVLMMKESEQRCWWEVMWQAKCCGCWISLLLWHNHSAEWPCHPGNRYTLYRACSRFYLSIYSRSWQKQVIDMPAHCNITSNWHAGDNKCWAGCCPPWWISNR